MPDRLPNTTLSRAIAIHQEGHLAEAESHYRGVLRDQPQNADAANLLGVAMFQQGRVGDAIRQLRKLVRARPDFAEAHYNLGLVLRADGKLGESAKSYRRAVDRNPNHPRALNNLGNVLVDLDRHIDAEPCFRRALAITPDNARAWHNLGICLVQMKRRREAFDAHRHAVKLAGDNPVFWDGWANSARGLLFTNADDEVRADLLRLLQHPIADPDTLVVAITSALSGTPAGILFSETESSSNSGRTPAELAACFSMIPLLLALLQLSIVNRIETEAALTRLRAGLLLDTPEDDAALPFLAAMADYCYETEYVFLVTPAENSHIETLRAAAEAGTTLTPHALAMLAAYMPLADLPNARELEQAAWPDAFADLVRHQITEPLAELAMRAEVPSVSPVENDVSLQVREQYEANPYPRWQRAHPYPEPLPVAMVLGGMPLVLDGIDAFPENPEILVAGCGTGRHAIRTVSRFSGANVLAIDLSTASLAYGLRMTQKLGIEGVAFAAGDILELGALDRRFDIIECMGVLHHMEAPLEGWNVLTGLLKPGGFMRIGLYSEIARRHLMRLRAELCPDGVPENSDAIRALRARLLKRATAPGADPELVELLSTRDFYTLSDCRDLLFHVQEHRFALPEISAALEDFGLRFLGFEQEQPVVARFNRLFPGRKSLASLKKWHEYEARQPKTFRNMYQFWCWKR